MTTTLRLIGYWEDDQNSGEYPDPKNHIDFCWEKERRDQIVSYLRSGHLFRGAWGHSTCRLDPTRDPREMGSKELTDGVYAWPEGLAVYVGDYGVVLPHEFVEHMERNQFHVPALPEGVRYIANLEFWKSWSK